MGVRHSSEKKLNEMKKLIFLALILRIFWMSITVHSDFWALVIGGYLIGEKKVVNIWDYYLSLPKDCDCTASFSAHPPLALFTFGVWEKVVSPITNQHFFEKLLWQFSKIYEQKGVIWHIFSFKILYLFFDFGIGFLLWNLFKRKKEKRQALLLWLFNPVVFYSLAVGNFDLIPLFWALLGFYFAQRGRLMAASIFLGIGAAYKIFPLFFLPLVIFWPKKEYILRFKVLMLGLIPLFLSIIPFYFSFSFRSVVLSHPVYQNLLTNELENLVPFLIIIYWIFYFSKDPQEVWKYFLAVLLTLFSVVDYHLQWFVWLMPFLIIEAVKDRFKFRVLGLTLVFCWLILLAFASPDLHLGLLVPLKSLGLFREVNPVVTSSFSPSVIIHSNSFNPKGLAKAIFTGTSLVMIYFILKEKNQSKKRVP